ncbi:MAG: DUF2855 family protein [Burkholderiaceae bacterium]
MNTQLLVRKDRIAETELHEAAEAPLAEGQVRVRIESFALTSNNITYAAFGDMMGYWNFFPTEREGWGIVPVWGFGTVVQSLCPGVAAGERLWGYWPMAQSAVLTPGRLSPEGFVESAPHRAGLPAAYNQYNRTNADPFYTPDSEDVQAILRPLYFTSWLIDDFLADNDFFGARTMLLSSASSKTSYGTAFDLGKREGLTLIGLTSPANVKFCESLGCYDRVLAYGQLDLVDAGTECVYVDFAGNAKLRRAIHERFANLKYSCAIGGTHFEELSAREMTGGGKLPGPKPTLFFAPAQLKKRSADGGREGLGGKLAAAWKAFRSEVARENSPWLSVQRHRGTQAAQSAYALVLQGKGDPRTGHMLAMNDNGQ